MLTSPSRTHSMLLGVGGYRPQRTVNNGEVCQLVDTTEQWIETRSGILSRRFADERETLPMMAAEAARQALATSAVDASEIDHIIVATCSNPVGVPSLASAVGNEIGAGTASGFDLNAACAGFCYALSAASDAICLGQAGYALVIGVERMRDIVDDNDKGTSFLFADGAGAAVVGPSETPGIGPVTRGSTPNTLGGVRMTSLWDDYPPASPPRLSMNGKRVFRWAMTDVVPAALRAIEAAGLTPRDLAAFVPHQANSRMIDIMVDALGLSPDIAVGYDVRESGNTSAASVPLALRRLLDDKAVDSGQPALLIGFGAGLTYCGQVVLTP